MSKRTFSSDSGNMEPSPKRAKPSKTKFQNSWLTEFDFVKRSIKGEHFILYAYCNHHIDINHSGVYDIRRHSNTTQHRDTAKMQSSIPKLNSLFKQSSTDNVTRADVLFCNFVAEHNLPFSVADHFTDICKEMFPDSDIAKKFSCKRTKTTNIINNAIAPMLDTQLTDLCQKNKFSVLIDESNDKGGDKTVANLVQVYDHAVKRVCTKSVGLPICNIGTSQNIFDTLNGVFREKHLSWANCIGFSSDNASVMVGKNNSVLTRIRSENPAVYDIGYICHLANLVVHYGMKTLPIAPDELLIDIYYHFQHSSKRKASLLSFQEFTDTQPMKILKHCAIRWLSLEKCLRRLVQQWPALLAYFKSHEESEKPGRVKRCLEMLDNQECWLYCCFLEFLLPIMNEFNTTFQAGESMIGHLCSEMTRLLRRLMGKFVKSKVITSGIDITEVNFNSSENQLDDDLIAVGLKTREYLREQEEDIAPETKKSFFRHVRTFYKEVIRQLLTKFPFKDNTLTTLSFLNPLTKTDIHTDAVVDLAVRFGVLQEDKQVSLLEQTEDYIFTPVQELPKFDNETTYLSQFWTEMGNCHLPSGKPRFDILTQVAIACLTLPHSNADAARSFSMLRKLQQDLRGRLNTTTIQSLMSAKMNTNDTCITFKPSSELLKTAKTACN